MHNRHLENQCTSLWVVDHENNINNGGRAIKYLNFKLGCNLTVLLSRYVENWNWIYNKTMSSCVLLVRIFYYNIQMQLNSNFNNHASKSWKQITPVKFILYLYLLQWYNTSPWIVIQWKWRTLNWKNARGKNINILV